MRNYKKYILAVSLALVLGCPGATVRGENVRMREMNYHEMSYEEELQAAADSVENSLKSDTEAPLTDDMILPSSFGIHVSISWSSSDENVISPDGRIHIPPVDKGNQTASLTAVFTSTQTTKTIKKTFDVTIKALNTKELLAKEAAQVQSYLNYVLNDGYTLPDKSAIGITSDIQWSVVSGEAVINNQILSKTSSSSEREPLTLRATLTNGSATQTVDINHLVLLDEYAGYVMSFFGGNDDKKTVHLAYSYDGIHFFALNGGNTILKTSAKSIKYQELRDPFLMRKKDGSFAVLATNGWTSTSIYLWDSENLTSFENERTAVLSVKGTVGLSGFHTWAPECNYDPLTDTYTVYWSDPEAENDYGKTFYNTSKDLVQFSEPGILFAADGSMIDASIKKYNGYYYMVYNDAYGDNDTGNGGKIIYMAKSASLTPGSFKQVSGALSPAGTISEGPFLFEDFKDGSWYVMYDHYGLHKFGVAKTNDLAGDNWDYLGVSETMPTENIRHGGVIPVTGRELSAIINAYRTDEPVCAEVPAPSAVTVTATSDKNAAISALPKNISVTLTDGQKTSESVTWDTSAVNTAQAGTYTVSGKVTIPSVSGDAVTDTAVKVQVTTDTAKTFPWGILAAGAGVVIAAAGCTGIFLYRKRRHHTN